MIATYGTAVALLMYAGITAASGIRLAGAGTVSVPVIVPMWSTVHASASPSSTPSLFNCPFVETGAPMMVSRLPALTWIRPEACRQVFNAASGSMTGRSVTWALCRAIPFMPMPVSTSGSYAELLSTLSCGSTPWSVNRAAPSVASCTHVPFGRVVRQLGSCFTYSRPSSRADTAQALASA